MAKAIVWLIGFVLFVVGCFMSGWFSWVIWFVGLFLCYLAKDMD